LLTIHFQLAAELGQYRTAVDLFEEVAVYEADHATLKYSAKAHFFQALLCYFLIDLVSPLLFPHV